MVAMYDGRSGGDSMAEAATVHVVENVQLFHSYLFSLRPLKTLSLLNSSGQNFPG
jgi:hypothetical protein